MNLNNLLSDMTTQPGTVEEAVDLLLDVLDSEHKIVIATMSEDELINLHFNLGMAIRNAFGLHDPDSKLLASCGVAHPDDASGVIIKELWNKLTQQ